MKVGREKRGKINKSYGCFAKSSDGSVLNLGTSFIPEMVNSFQILTFLTS